MKHLCNILSDRPNINQIISRELDVGLKERGNKGL